MKILDSLNIIEKLLDETV